MNLKTMGLLICAILVISGCASTKEARRQEREIAIHEVAGIIKEHDCEVACEALKAYVKAQIGEVIK
jgi:hypothetical protein